jgi:hypothetical protein
MTNQTFYIAGLVEHHRAARLADEVARMDPSARLEVDSARQQLNVQTALPGEAIEAAITRAGLRVLAWAAELPMIGGYARRRGRASVLSSLNAS